MFGKASLLAIAGVTLMAAPSVANAAATISFDGVAGVYGNARPGPTNDLLDVLTFSVPRSGKISVDWTTFWSRTPGSTHRTNLKGTVALNGTTLTGVDTVTPAGLLKVRSLSDLIVAAGTQTIVVSGAAAENARYSGTFSFTGGVPEPTVWALMIVGLGGVAVAMRRSNRRAGRMNFAVTCA